MLAWNAGHCFSSHNILAGDNKMSVTMSLDSDQGPLGCFDTKLPPEKYGWGLEDGCVFFLGFFHFSFFKVLYCPLKVVQG